MIVEAKERVVITGVNHITLAVHDVSKSFDFYARVLGCKPVARWENGAYLTAGETWIALVKDNANNSKRRNDCSHIAFTCEQD